MDLKDHDQARSRLPGGEALLQRLECPNSLANRANQGAISKGLSGQGAAQKEIQGSSEVKKSLLYPISAAKDCDVKMKDSAEGGKIGTKRVDYLDKLGGNFAEKIKIKPVFPHPQ